MDVPSQPEAFQRAVFLTRQQLLERQLNDVRRITRIGTWEFFIVPNQLVCSDEVRCILGLNENSVEVNIDTYVSAVHPDDRLRVLAAIEQARNALAYPVLEHRVVWPNGEVRRVRVRGCLFRNENGNAALFGTVQDITARIQSGESLHAMSRKLLIALDNLTDAFFMLDNDWRFACLNKEAERLLRRSRADLLGKHVFEAFPDGRGTQFEAECRQAIQQNRPSIFEELYVALNTWMEVRLFPSKEGLSVYLTDISERKRLQEVERYNAERFQVVARITTDVIWDWNPVVNKTCWNSGVENVFGYSTNHFKEGMPAWARLIHPEERDRVVAGLLTAMYTGQEEWRDEYRFLRKGGSYADVRDRGFIIRNDEGVVVRVIGGMVDITKQKQAETERARIEARNRMQASLLDKAQDAITVTDIEGRITYWNKGAERLFGWSADEAIGKTRAELRIADPQAFGVVYQVLQKQGDWTGEVQNRRKDGSTLIVESHLTLMRDDDGQPQSILAIQTDITQRKKAEKEIEELAFFDPLTRLPNRRFMLDRLRHAVAACKRNRQSYALLFLDLDNFKSLNDTLGHDKGDLLLQQVALRLRATVSRACDTVARHGGDEFVIVLEDLSVQTEEAAGHAAKVAEKIQAALEAPFQLDGHQHYTSASIGVALFDQQIDHIDELLKRADLAMYQAKMAGRNTIRFFDPEMQSVINARAQLEAELRSGLRQHEFRLHYQRQTDGDGHTIGVEALVRWDHPRNSQVSPAMFIALAEETGLILQLGQWVLEAACQQLVAWAEVLETAHLTVAVNVSAHQFHQPTFVEQVLQVIERTGADPKKLKLELTESILVTDVERTVDKMNALRAKGIRFALDDFGTGYSSLAYLKRLPLDQLKIDQSFVRDVLTDPSDAAIARTILVLGQMLGLDVIAEGVETLHQRDFLAHIGCRAYQGYLFSRPVPAEQF